MPNFHRLPTVNTLPQQMWGRAVPSLIPPISVQKVASLQGALKADTASGEMVSPATARHDASEWDVDDTGSEGSDSDLRIQGQFL